MLVSIIGTAGRREAAHQLTAELYLEAFDHVDRLLTAQIPNAEDRHLKSGGAAWMDHIAVGLFLRGKAASLDLHLPAPFDSSTYRFLSNGERSDGDTANYYHTRFSHKLTRDPSASLRGIQRAIEAGARVTVGSGFKDRNFAVAYCDWMIALTFGRLDVPADGGTKHTWSISRAPIKTHVPLHELQERVNARKTTSSP